MDEFHSLSFFRISSQSGYLVNSYILPVHKVLPQCVVTGEPSLKNRTFKENNGYIDP